MTKILFVCHGNICRSPMAEFIFKDMVSKAGLAAQFIIASAATSTEEIWNGVGNPVYPPARSILASHGISCAGKRARRMTKQDYKEYDCLIGMETRNVQNMIQIAGGDPEHRIFRLLDLTPHPRDIADPWYTGDFQEAYADILEGCEALLRKWKEEGKIR